MTMSTLTISTLDLNRTPAQQWCSRPRDERFWTLEEARDYALGVKERSVELFVRMHQLEAVGLADNELGVVGAHGVPALPSHHAFGQLCRLAGQGIPTGYLRRLPAALAAENLNHHLQANGDKHRNVLFQQEGTEQVRMSSFVSDAYTRTWDWEVLQVLKEAAAEYGWKVPPGRPASGYDERTRPATANDCLEFRGLGLSIKPGDMIAPAGIYASDHDMFAFLINEERPIRVPGTDVPLIRGLVIDQSQVGDRAFHCAEFLFAGPCGNHNLWGVNEESASRQRIVHRGEVSRREILFQTRQAMERAQDRTAWAEEQLIARLHDTKVGDNKREVISRLFSKKVAARAELEQAYEIAALHPEDGHKGPDTAWGMMQGLTRLSQQAGFTDQREAIDKAATKIAKLQF